MPLTPGTQVGPYELVASIGEGGMGEVYRARDHRLGRDVALKVIRAGFAQDSERRRRFDQEARAVAALNHPNVLAIHDVGEHDGAPYLVTELLDGATLRQRLGEGPVPLRKALDWARQAALGLAAAHDKGLVHRDLKPENLFVTRDGRLKILDFGIARALGPIAESTLSATASGSVIGTAGYMAPEQVRGLPADARSDLFSLGAVLFELIAARQAFGGDTPVERAYAVLNTDVSELASLVGAGQAGVERVVRRCLEKAPEERFQSARDLAFALEALAESPSGPVTALPPGRRVAGLRVLSSLALVAAIAGAFALGQQHRGPDVVAPAVAAAVPAQPTFTRISYRAGRLFTARFAKDGRTVVYGAAFEGGPPTVYSATIGKPEARPITQPWSWLFDLSSNDELAIFLAPKDRTKSEEVMLAVAPIEGGTPREVLEGLFDAAWAPDGRQLAIIREQGSRTRLEFPIGKVLLDTDDELAQPRVSPDGELVAFFATAAGDFHWRLELVSKQGVRSKLAGPWASEDGLAWAPDGRSLWLAAGDRSSFRSIRSITLDGGARVALTAPGTLRLCDVAPDGRVLVIRPEERWRIVGRQAPSAPEVDLSWFDASWPVDLSADGRTMLFGVSGQAPAVLGAGFGRSAGATTEVQAFLRPTGGSAAVRLSAGLPLALSPDGKWAVVSTTAPFNVLAVVPTGPGEPRQLPAGPLTGWVSASYFSDGERLLLLGREPGHKRRAWVQVLSEGLPRPISDEGVESAAASPDGRLVAATFEGGRAQLIPLDGGVGRTLDTFPASRVMRWSADGTSLFVRLVPTGQAALPTEIARYELKSGKLTPWLKLSPADVVGVPPLDGLGSVLLSADGLGYVYGYLRDVGDLYVVEGLN